VCAVGPCQVVEALPLGELFGQIHVVLVAEQLVELLLVGSVRPLDLAIQLRRARLDVGMPDALVLDMPVEPGLELVAVVGADLPDPKREGFDDVVDEVDGICLVVSFVDPEGADACRVVDGGELEPPDLLAALSHECQKLDVHLDMAAGQPSDLVTGGPRPREGG